MLIEVRKLEFVLNSDKITFYSEQIKYVVIQIIRNQGDIIILILKMEGLDRRGNS